MSENVDYDLEFHDDLPVSNTSPGGSVLEDQLRRIAGNLDNHAPRWGRIAKYANPAAAHSSKNTLQRRHGSTAEVEGWRFEVRRVDNGQYAGLFAQFDPKAAIPGKREENQVEYRAYQDRQKEARARNAADKARRDAENHAEKRPVPAKAKV